MLGALLDGEVAVFGVGRGDFDEGGDLFFFHARQVLHDALHVVQVSHPVEVFVKNLHVSFVPFWRLLVLRFHVDILLEVVVGGSVHIETAVEAVDSQVFLVVVDEELEADGVDELLELGPVEGLDAVAVELGEDGLELAVLQRVNHAPREVYHSPLLV